jgi:hypothetical protein
VSQIGVEPQDSRELQEAVERAARVIRRVPHGEIHVAVHEDAEGIERAHRDGEAGDGEQTSSDELRAHDVGRSESPPRRLPAPGPLLPGGLAEANRTPMA